MIQSVKYSVIIPALNESSIEETINHVRSLFPIVEIIVCAAGSLSDTSEKASIADQIVRVEKPSRGRQCNKGAEKASGEILIFLHADTRLPENTFEILENFFSKYQKKVATFRLKFDVDHILLDSFSYLSKFDSVFTRFGDTCLIFRRDFFDKIGRFPDYPLFEDVKILQKARKLTRVYSLPAYVITSARRKINNGLIQQQILNIRLIIKYLFGASPENLSSEYRSYVKHEGHSAIIVFARYPTAGKVKTRLAEYKGNGFAAGLYRATSERIINMVKKLRRIKKYIFYSDPAETKQIRRWCGARFYYSVQTGEDIGIRMKNAFAKTFSHGANKVILIGTDVPDISASLLNKAFKALDENDFVIGPAHDGGYYLLGMRNFTDKVFTDISWSTDTVYSATTDAIKNLNKSFYALPCLHDIDTEKHLREWLREGKVDSFKKRISKIESNGEVWKAAGNMRKTM